MDRKFIVGPPGTGKTRYLVNLYYDKLQVHPIERTQIISHTNVAADEICERIYNEKNAKEYEEKNNVQIWDKLEENKKLFVSENKEDRRVISTISYYCKENLRHPPMFDKESYIELCRRHPFFMRHYSNKKSFDLKSLSSKHPFFKAIGFAADNGMTLPEWWRTLHLNDQQKYRYTRYNLEELNDYYQDFKSDYKVNKKSDNLLDFIDIIKKFNDKAPLPELDLLIVDEAQDCSVPQLNALKKMETNVKESYWAGDPDQAIFEFAGAKPSVFADLAKNPFKELKEGYRCPRIINEYCKKVISPVWDKYEGWRTWKPREELNANGERTGVVVEGEKHLLENLEHCPKLPLLIEKLYNGETAIFCYRAEGDTSIKPYNSHNFKIRGSLEKVTKFLKKHGFRYGAWQGDPNTEDSAYVPNWELECHRNFKLWVESKPIHISLIEKMFKKSNSLLIARKKENFNPKDIKSHKLIQKEYTFDEFVKLGLVNKEAKQYKDFFAVKVKDDIERKQYIKKTMYHNLDLQKKIKIFYGNFHKIKGSEFDNSIVDETITRDEAEFTRLRLRYVACSRARKSLFLLKTSTGKKL
tara:strand:+ start:211 stop:1959 length:1749 start_codon:yes stop_codon:yes gene_type:complete